MRYSSDCFDEFMTKQCNKPSFFPTAHTSVLWYFTCWGDEILEVIRLSIAKNLSSVVKKKKKPTNKKRGKLRIISLKSTYSISERQD